MRRHIDAESSSEAGMDLFATLFAIFMLITGVAVLLINTPRVPSDDRYLLLGYRIVGATLVSLPHGLQVYRDDTLLSIISPDGSIAFGEAPTRVLLSEVPGEIAALYDEAEAGEYRIEFQFNDTYAWAELVRNYSDATVCLVRQYPGARKLVDVASENCNPVAEYLTNSPDFAFSVSYWQE